MSGLEDGPLQREWPDKPAGATPHIKRKGFFRELPFLIALAILIALLVKTFLVQAFFIPSESMEPTLHGCEGCRGDRVLVNRLVYRFRKPRRGEIIVFGGRHNGPDTRSAARKLVDFLTEGLGVTRPSNTDYIKRIIGLPGESLSVKDGKVTITRVDGKKLTLVEPYLSPVHDDRPFGPVKVPVGEYFMMGDNRTMSADSRYGLGTIRLHDIIGKAFVKIWPPGRWGRLSSVRYKGDYPGGLPSAAIIVIVTTRRRRRGARILEGAGRNGGEAA